MHKNKSLLLHDHDPSWLRGSFVWRVRSAFKDPEFTFDTIIENVYDLRDELNTDKWVDPSFDIPVENRIIQTLLTHDLFVDTSVELSHTRELLQLYMLLILKHGQPGIKNLYFMRPWKDMNQSVFACERAQQFIEAGHRIWVWEPTGFTYEQVHQYIEGGQALR